MPSEAFSLEDILGISFLITTECNDDFFCSLKENESDNEAVRIVLLELEFQKWRCHERTSDFHIGK